MNSWILLGTSLCAAAFMGVIGSPATKGRPHRAVFEFVSEEPKAQEALLNNIENLLASFKGGIQVAVVAHGPGLSLLHRTAPAVAERITRLAKPSVVFLACENTMRKQNIGKADLIPVAGTVDSGVAEVVRRQEDGWSYIKAGP